jgi:hypothetical protein
MSLVHSMPGKYVDPEKNLRCYIYYYYYVYVDFIEYVI